jgi:hypothetical protein
VGYKEVHGHCNVPNDNGSLGAWCGTVRQGRKKGTLSSERIAQLDALGFLWEPFATLWNEMFTELAAYKEANGDCNVSQSNGSLGIWCNTQRRLRKQGNLSQEQMAQLDALGFCWDPRDTLWDKKIIELMAYKKVNGHCNASHGDGSLWSWCRNLRNRYKRGTLSADQLAQLGALGFCWDPLAALWDKNYAELVAYKTINGDCAVPRSNVSLSGWCLDKRNRRRRGKLTPEQIEKLDAIGFYWEPYIDYWEKMFAELVAYKKVHGNCNVLKDSGPLGAWCTQQRSRKVKLSPERIARLDALEFCWDIRDALWDKNYIELVAYKKVNGHCNVSHGNGPLGLWCANLRNRRSKLMPERIAQLDALGFCWEPHDTAWEKSVIELVAYKEVNGDCHVPQSGGLLGNWCTKVRQLRKRGTLSPERIAQLDALRFCWDPLAALWDKNYAELVAHKKVNGHCRVVDSGAFGNWCRNVRQYRKQGKLSPEKIAQLDAIGFCWDPFAAAWDKNVAELVAYKEINGNCNVPIDSGPLGTWCDNIRQRRGKLSPERIAQLDAIGFCWNFYVAAWDKTYAELVAYKEVHGHCNVPQADGSLGVRCSSLRQYRKQGKLTPEQIAQLDAIGFCWNTLAAAWDEKYAELVAYKEVHGHCNVPQDNGSLGSWCNNQRNRRNNLTPDRIAQLDALGFCWQFRVPNRTEIEHGIPPVDLVNPAEGVECSDRVAASTD